MKSNLSTKETLLYNNREKSEIIFINNLTSDNVHDVEKQMTARQMLFSGRAKNLTAHIIISPGIEDGRKQTRLDWKEIGQSFLQKAGLSSYQSIAYLHKDKEHFHLHIVANRIDANGKIYRKGNELVMSQRIGDEIAAERGLTRAAEVRKERMLARKKGIINIGENGTVSKMRKVATEAATIAWSSGKFESAKYFECLKSNGYEVRWFYKKDHENKDTEEVRGYAVGKMGDHFINASQIGSEFTLGRLNRETPFKSLHSKSDKESIEEVIRKDLTHCFDTLIEGDKKFDAQLFLSEIRAKGYTVKEYLNKDTNKLRGYGIEVGGIVYNASELGSEFTLTNLRKRHSEGVFSEGTPEKPTRNESKENDLTVETHQPDTEDQISMEFKRTIDLALISSDLRDLTSGHKYQSYQNFIQLLEEKGYHVHLRYKNGGLSGYTVHKGIEHYHDTEIEDGRFSLAELFKKGVFRNPEVNNFFPLEERTLKGKVIVNFESENHSSDKRYSGTLSGNLKNAVEQKGRNKNEFSKEEARKAIAKELRTHLQFFKDKNDSVNSEKFFSCLSADGYEIIKHFQKETDLLRGYSLKKYGFVFNASEIGREFSLKKIGIMGIKHAKNNLMS